MNYQPVIDFIRFLYPNRDFIPLHEPYFRGDEKEYLVECIDSTFVSSVGKYVDMFEEKVRDFTGARYAIATVNGTAALHIALILAGVEQGDLVITQPLTFIATCNAISYCGAEPVFVDIDTETLGMSPESLESWLEENISLEGRDCLVSLEGHPQPSQLIAIHKATKKRISACVPMHTFGHPCRIDKIVEICNRYHIPVVEDSAESIGSCYKGQHTGTFGKLGFLSFNGNKTITTGGGGMILTDDEKLGPLAKHITTTAKKPHPWKFEHDMIGYNYRMPNINAALGCAQMEMLPKLLNGKRWIADQYKAWFTDYESIQFFREPEQAESNHWLNAIILQDEQQRDAFLEYTNDHKIQTRPAWTLMSQLSMFGKCISQSLSNAVDLSSRLVNIPSSFPHGK